MPTYAGERSRAAIYDAAYRTRKRLGLAETDEARARLSALLAGHEAELAACDAARPVSPDDGKKSCSKCKARLEINEHNFVRRKDRRSSWYSECRECTNARRRDINAAGAAPTPAGWRKCRRCLCTKPPAEFRLARGNRVSTRCAACLDYKAGQNRRVRAMAKAAKVEAWADPTAPPERPKPGPKPGPKPDGIEAMERERRDRERVILVLISRYEAIRPYPGPDRTAAYNALGLALSRHGRPVSDGVREWSWARGLGEVTSRLIRREWKPPEDPHANPRRLARTR